MGWKSSTDQVSPNTCIVPLDLLKGRGSAGKIYCLAGRQKAEQKRKILGGNLPKKSGTTFPPFLFWQARPQIARSIPVSLTAFAVGLSSNSRPAGS